VRRGLTAPRDRRARAGAAYNEPMLSVVRGRKIEQLDYGEV
jgi:hypothetical protein